MNVDIAPGAMLIANGRVVEVDGQETLTTVRVRDVATGEFSTVPIAQLAAIKPKQGKADSLAVFEAEWKRACALALSLRPWQGRARVPSSTLGEIASAHRVSTRQIQRLRHRLQAADKTSALVRQVGGWPTGRSRLSAKVELIIAKLTRKYFLKRERPSQREFAEYTRSVCRRIRLEAPSRNAVLLRLARLDPRDRDRARLGRHAAKQKHEARPGQLLAHRPLELIEIDHTRADVMVVDPENRSRTLGRPWLTLAIDVATRCVVGFYLSMDAPSATSVAMCIEHLVLPKRENASDPDVWPMYGKPGRILVDNGKDFRSLALSRGCQEHGITLEFRPVKTPHYGAHIERLIGTMMRMCHLLPGTTFSNPRERGDYPSEAKAIMTLAELRAWLVQKICRRYHMSRHSELGCAPLIAWEKGFRRDDGSLATPALLADPTQFRIDFLPYELRKVRRTGIELFGLRYWHEDLAPLLIGEDDVMVRYDPRDVTSVWIRREDGLIVEAPVVSAQVAHLSRFEWLNRARREESAAERARRENAIDAGYAATDAIEAEAARLTRRARRRASRQMTYPRSELTPAPVAADADLPQTLGPAPVRYVASRD